jgi:hypothetical protein
VETLCRQTPTKRKRVRMCGAERKDGRECEDMMRAEGQSRKIRDNLDSLMRRNGRRKL